MSDLASGSAAVVIVGGGLAGAKAAETLRSEGSTAPITVVAAEPVRPYERPPLSKGRLAGTDDPDGIYVHATDWYAEHDVDLLVGTEATALDRAGRRLTLSDGRTLEYGKLLLATGSRSRTLPSVQGDNVFTLRTVADSEALNAELAAGGRKLVVIGAGWIGLEVSAVARGLGNDVTVIEPQPAPLLAAIGERMGTVFADLHREHGVDLRLSTGFTETVGENGRITGVRTDAGDLVPADLVLVGIGAVPNLELATAAGLDIDAGGVAVDAALRTADPDIWAAGDIAAAEHPVLGRRVRVEHWGNALAGGEAAAKSILGQDVSYDVLPYFFSDQYDLGMEFTGLPGREDEVVVRGDLAAREFIAFYTRDGRVTAGMNVNVWDVTEDIKALITSGKAVDPARLADPAVPLSDLLG